MQVSVDGQEFVSAIEMRGWRSAAERLQETAEGVREERDGARAVIEDLQADYDAAMVRVTELEEYVEKYDEIKQVAARLLDALASKRVAISRLECMLAERIAST